MQRRRSSGSYQVLQADVNFLQVMQEFQKKNLCLNCFLPFTCRNIFIRVNLSLYNFSYLKLLDPLMFLALTDLFFQVSAMT